MYNKRKIEILMQNANFYNYEIAKEIVLTCNNIEKHEYSIAIIEISDKYNVKLTDIKFGLVIGIMKTLNSI